MSTLVASQSCALNVERARELLALARTTDEAKDIRDKAEAVRMYLRQQKASLEAQNDAAEIKLRAERRLGELSAEMETNERARTDLSPGAGLSCKATSLAEQGISKQRANEWEKIARLPEDAFEGYIADVREEEGEITTAGALRLARKLDPTPRATPDLLMRVAKSIRLSARTKEGLCELVLRPEPIPIEDRAVIVGAIDDLLRELVNWREAFEETNNGNTESQDDVAGDCGPHGGEDS